jgi:hypothetical protein
MEHSVTTKDSPLNPRNPPYKRGQGIFTVRAGAMIITEKYFHD